MNSSPDAAAAVRRSMRLYLLVGLVLFGGTVATVAVATVPALDIGKHGFDKWDMVLGLTIASFKASLVALIFMHLNHERRLIYWLAGFAAMHCVGMISITLLAEADTIHDPTFYRDTRGPAKEGFSFTKGQAR
jgi:caa(3)-type oxidase subunit IV